MHPTNKEIIGQVTKSKFPAYLQEHTENALEKLFEPTPPVKHIKRFNIDRGSFHLSIGYALYSWGLGVNIEGSGLKDWELVVRFLPLFLEVGVY